MKTVATFLILAFLSAVCVGAPDNSALLFRSGFEPGTNIKIIDNQKAGKLDVAYLIGADVESDYDWDKLNEVIGIKDRMTFEFWGTHRGVDADLKIVDDPDRSRGKVLYSEYLSNSESGIYKGVTSLTQASLKLDSNFKQLGVRYKIKISEAYNALLAPEFALDSNADFGWWLISEMWTLRHQDGTAGSQPIYLRKSEKGFTFSAVMRYRDGHAHPVVWTVDNNDFTLPIVKWIEIVHFVRVGKAGEARLYFSVDGVVVFDIQDKDIEWKGMDWRSWSCMKAYQNQEITNFLRERGTPSETWYDDFEIWSGIPK